MKDWIVVWKVIVNRVVSININTKRRGKKFTLSHDEFTEYDIIKILRKKGSTKDNLYRNIVTTPPSQDYTLLLKSSWNIRRRRW